MTFIGGKPSHVDSAITARLRARLMDGTAIGPWLYGASRKLCEDSAWQIIQKNARQLGDT